MSLKTSYLLPHSPLLIPEISKINYSFFSKTSEAYNQAIQKMKALKVETVIIFSPHLSEDKKRYKINVAPEMEVDLREFGLIPPKTFCKGDAVLADSIKETLGQSFPVSLLSEKILDYGSAVPVYLFKQADFSPKIIVISIASELERKDQLNFGFELSKLINKTEKHIAIIASGDLSHKLQKKSPGGYSPKASKFDNKIIEILSEEETAATEIIKLDNNWSEQVGECASSPLTALLGVLKEKKFNTEILAYQTDFGVGYLSAELNIES